MGKPDTTDHDFITVWDYYIPESLQLQVFVNVDKPIELRMGLYEAVCPILMVPLDVDPLGFILGLPVCPAPHVVILYGLPQKLLMFHGGGYVSLVEASPCPHGPLIVGGEGG